MQQHYTMPMACLTITITKHCGGTPVSSASALFNLVHKQKLTINITDFVFSDIAILQCNNNNVVYTIPNPFLSP